MDKGSQLVRMKSYCDPEANKNMVMATSCLRNMFYGTNLSPI